jgi:hypothetical protein
MMHGPQALLIFRRALIFARLAHHESKFASNAYLLRESHRRALAQSVCDRPNMLQGEWC